MKLFGFSLGGGAAFKNANCKPPEDEEICKELMLRQAKDDEERIKRLAAIQALFRGDPEPEENVPKIDGFF